MAHRKKREKAKGDVAQPGERCLCKAEAGGSSPPISIGEFEGVFRGEREFKTEKSFKKEDGHIDNRIQYVG